MTTGRTPPGAAPVGRAAARRLIVEADGGARGNPGPAGFGAVVRDAATREVLAERSGFLGVATNNVAEYRGLIAGLQAAADIDPAAEVEVRLDSRLLVEQMTGRWQVKHPDLRPLAGEAARLISRFPKVTFTWVPREANAHADRLANAAMDAGTGAAAGTASVAGTASAAGSPRRAAAKEVDQRVGVVGAYEVHEIPNRIAGWMPAPAHTRLVLVRHGVTSFTLEKRFSGTGDPPLVEQGRRQVAALAERLRSRGDIEVIVSSPLARCRQTAAAIAEAVELPVAVDDDLREVDFGLWEGLTFAVVERRWPRELALWLADTAISPPNGESYDELRLRISAVASRIVNRNRGRTVCVVTHSRPIAMFVANALAAPVASIYRLHVEPASITEIDYYEDGVTVLRCFDDTAHLAVRDVSEAR
ncbi:MAG: bifunctional RNase H/acid phosphatase [Acidothermus sp.]|nr:bifunctional RNase H/acid phosphatase [Acidothermus sp.]